MIKVEMPQITVTLFKMANKTGDDIDLTPFLADGDSIQVTKDIDQPAGGFSFSFPDRAGGPRLDTIYALVEPMDLIEIRASREAWRYAGGVLPLIMRGFVSSVRRSEAMGADGSPVRVVQISGQDAGKLWLVNQFDVQLAYSLEQPLIEQFRLQAATGLGTKFETASEFIADVTNKVINEKIKDLNAISSSQFPAFEVSATVKEGSVSPFSMGSFQGPYWQLINSFSDRPWNELFVEDRGEIGAEVPTVVFRPSPLKDLDGAMIMPGATDPGFITVNQTAVINLDIGRSDARVANVFWVPPGASMIENNLMVTVAQLATGKMLDFGYQHNDQRIFGIRRMNVSSTLVATEIAVLPAQQEPDERDQSANSYQEWFEHRRDQLKALNRDNSVWEEGQAIIKGDEHIKPGTYLRLKREKITYEFYCNKVSHTFTPLRDWKTSVGLVRGTCFWLRQDEDGAYFSEGRRGPYSVSP